MIIDLNKWLSKQYNKGKPRVSSIEFYNRVSFSFTGKRVPGVSRQLLIEEFGPSPKGY